MALVLPLLYKYNIIMLVFENVRRFLILPVYFRLLRRSTIFVRSPLITTQIGPVSKQPSAMGQVSSCIPRTKFASYTIVHPIGTAVGESVSATTWHERLPPLEELPIQSSSAVNIQQLQIHHKGSGDGQEPVVSVPCNSMQSINEVVIPTAFTAPSTEVITATDHCPS